MEVKKSKKADLEGQKSTSMLIGYIFALGALFAAFEWTTRDYKETDPVIYRASTNMEDEIPPITQPIFQAAPPPPQEVPEVPEIFDIVDDEEEIEETEMVSSEETNEALSGPSAPSMGASIGPQITGEENDEDDIFQVVEEMPEFPGGMEALLKYLGTNIRYPTIAQEQQIQGKVVIEFVVNRDGSIVDPKVIKPLDPSCDKEAMRVIRAMPRWKPGKQRGKPVRVKYTVPVSFKLT